MAIASSVVSDGLTRRSVRRRAFFVVATALAAATATGQSPDIPIVPGVNVVLAIANAAPSAGAASGKEPVGVLRGDYEMVVSLTNVTAAGITHLASFDGVDAGGAPRSGSVTRVVSAADVTAAPVQILGFHQQDPPQINGTTSLGPSLGVVRSLATSGASPYAFKLWGSQDTISGTLRRSANASVKFPVLLNGRRVELDAIHATGDMAVGTAKRPFETVILNHPRYPISLRIAYGPRDGGFPFTPDFAREVVRIDFPVPRGTAGDGGAVGTPPAGGVGASAGGGSIAEALNKECRAELSGIYFDFNQATLKPQSERALKEIASALQTARRPIGIEGHTDNIGSDSYNDDLSSRRAAAVKTALVRDYGIDAGRLSTAGLGERRPVETNDTLAGRARNRRVELVCAAGK